MASVEAGNPFHIARAYQIASVHSPEGPLKVAPSGVRIAPAAPSAAAAQRPSRLDRLIGGIVQGRINFAGEQPAQVGSALAMYRHPADKNTAATAVHAGRVLDTTA